MYHIKTISTAEIGARKEGDLKIFTAKITSSSLDRDCEVVLPSGMNAKNYFKNPIVLWMHDSMVPIGKCTGLARAGNSDWMAEFYFAPNTRNMQNWEPERIKSLVESGILKGVSVGFWPKAYRNATAEDREKYGQDCVRVISEWDLHEFSIVSIPSNPDALISGA